ncbi:MAG: L-serine ammonia-lyase [Desulfovibrio sp.]|jgi:L-serine dehydratase|nr:L-serine ammonia-lyase [Desulfovibrio sp.]
MIRPDTAPGAAGSAPAGAAPQATAPPIGTTIFELFKTGPGPSSSHTMAPMSAGHDFLCRCRALPTSALDEAARIEVRLFGSLSATGIGHGTAGAILAGLLGHEPAACPSGLPAQLAATPEKIHTVSLGDRCLPCSLGDVIRDAVVHDFPFANTMTMALLDARGGHLLDMEYYSTGGGFLQWKGWTPPERGTPRHPYVNMRQLRERLKETGLTLHELILENESAITGIERPAIFQRLQGVMEAMHDSVLRGLEASGQLPGTLGVARKAQGVHAVAKDLPYTVDRFLGRINAYALAVSEENAAGGTVVTAPTCGAAGVMPALLHAMRHDLNIGGRALREGVLASAAVGFLAKSNAAIAGAEVGCQGEVGVASAMAAAMLAHARGYAVVTLENAAEIALEHHLGLTCDPVGGYVQIPCIERNAVGAVKAYNACLLATCEDPKQHMVSLDAVIRAMAETGRDMNAKFKETSAGGLAVSMVDC